MKKVIPILFLLAFTNCTKTCEVEKVISGGLSGAVALALQCSNPGQIQTDIMKVLDSNSVCRVASEKQQKTGAVAMMVCPLVVMGAVTLLGSQVPVNWQCKPDLATKGLASVLTTLCNALPF